MKHRFLIQKCMVLFLLVLNCGSRKESVEVTLESFKELKDLVNSSEFIFIAETAYSMQSNDMINVTNALMRQTENANGRFSLSANDDYMVIAQKMVKAKLSYFGEMRTASYSDTRDTSIIFENEPLVYKIKENERKKTLELTYRVKNSTEQFNVKMLLFSNKTASVYIYSSNRATIRYEGKLRRKND